MIPRRRALQTALLFSCLALAAVAAQAEPVDRIVAAVNDEVITASELADTVALNRRLGRSPATVRTAGETLQGIIMRRLLVQEARRLKFVDVSSQDLAAYVERVRKNFATDSEFNDFLASLDLSAAELGRMLEEQLLVERFIEKKVGLFVRVDRDEAEAYFALHRDRFAASHFADVQKSITALLVDQKIDQQLDQYVAELRAKADIRIIAP